MAKIYTEQLLLPRNFVRRTNKKVYKLLKHLVSDTPYATGTIPDHIIIPGIEDILNNKDVQLAIALKLAAGN